jgi:hypothetical protein
MLSVIIVMLSGCSSKNDCLLKYDIALKECNTQTKFITDEKLYRQQYDQCLQKRGYTRGNKDCF